MSGKVLRSVSDTRQPEPAIDGLKRLLRPLNDNAVVEKIERDYGGRKGHSFDYNVAFDAAIEAGLSLIDLYGISFSFAKNADWALEEFGWLIGLGAVEVVRVDPTHLLVSFLPREV